jgi:hypothetical protein
LRVSIMVVTCSQAWSVAILLSFLSFFFNIFAYWLWLVVSCRNWLCYSAAEFNFSWLSEIKRDTAEDIFSDRFSSDYFIKRLSSTILVLSFSMISLDSYLTSSVM